MKTLRTLAIVGLLCGMGAGASLASAQPFSSPAQVQHDILTGNPQQALKELAPVLKANPRSAEAHYLEAEALDASGQPTLAKQALMASEKLSPNMPFARKQRLAELERRLGVTNPHTKSLHHVLAAFAVFALLVLAVLGFLLLRRKRGAERELAESAKLLMAQLNEAISDLQGWLPEAKLKGTSHGLTEDKINERLQQAARLISELKNMLETSFDKERWERTIASVRKRSDVTSVWDTSSAPVAPRGSVDESAVAPGVPVFSSGAPAATPAAPASPLFSTPSVVVQQPASDPLGSVLQTALIMDALEPRQTVIERDVVVDEVPVQSSAGDTSWNDAPDDGLRSGGSFGSDTGLDSTSDFSSDSSSDSSSDFGSDSSASDSSGWDSGSDDGLSSDSGSDWN